MQLGFIGFGEVGFEISRGLKEEGLTGIIAYDPLADDPKNGALVKERAKEAGVGLAGSPVEVAERCNVIIAAVPGGKALPAALSVVAALRGSKIYVDASTSSPKTKQTIAAAVLPTGAGFVDAALMGLLSISGHRIPTIISGDGSDRFIELMAPYHMCLEKISDKPGDAIAIKLIRSIYLKGMGALAVELLEAATALKVETRVLKSIGDTLNGFSFEENVHNLVASCAVHATRQVHEMADVAAMLTELGIEPLMTDATRKRLEWLEGKKVKEKFAGKRPKRWEQVVQAWEKSD